MTTCPLLWSFRFYPQFTSECAWLSGTQGKPGLYLDLEAPPTRGGPPLACMPRLLPSPGLVPLQTLPAGCVLPRHKASHKRKRHSGRTAHASAYLARHRRSPTETPAGGRKANPLGERALRERLASGASGPRWEVGVRALPAQRRAPLRQSLEHQPLSLRAAGALWSRGSRDAGVWLAGCPGVSVSRAPPVTDAPLSRLGGPGLRK